MDQEFEERLVLALISAGWDGQIDAKQHLQALRKYAADGNANAATAIRRYRDQARAAFAVCHAQRSMIC
jgi:hypothetical protein